MQDSKNQQLSNPLTQGKKPRSFRLVRYFTVISLASIMVTSILLGSWVRQVAVTNLIKNEERSNIALAQVLTNSVWPRFQAFIYSAHQLHTDEIRSRTEIRELDTFLDAQVSGLSVIKIKIYNIDGLTVFSSDFKQVGESRHANALFLAAKSGKVASKLSFRDKIYAENELVESRNVIASYVPVRRGDKNEIVGVFEVYKDVTPVVKEINHTQIKIVVGVVGTLTVLFFVLYFVIRHADKIIRENKHAQEQVTEQIRHVAFYDSLTNLPNRVLFLERLEHALRVAERSKKLVALMFIDLDRFKQVNDNLGHEAGDELLRQAAARFNHIVRAGDSVSRISGDEFTILLENLQTIEFATTVAQRVVSAMAQAFLLGEIEVYVTCSIGLSIYPFDDDDASSLVKKADAAMYFSKSYGRNNYHYYSPDMMRHGSSRYELETDLNNAISESQFQVYFQPKVNLDDWSMHGMEALLRWHHPERGMIPPDEFIPILEETGMIIQVGEWVIRESCRLVKKWQDEGLPPLRVAVNVSAIQFHQPGFFDMLESILAETGLEARYLELELTESCLMENISEHVEVMQLLQDKGVMLTIDDFGTGYSSLSYLCKLPVGTLKIDRSFISDMSETREKRSVVTAIISFAHGLRMDIVVEGIETVEQLTFVAAMRCTAVQGYLLSKPVSEQDFYQMYRDGKDFKRLIDAGRDRSSRQAL